MNKIKSSRQKRVETMFDFLKKKKTEPIWKPVGGEMKEITEVEDPVFSNKTMGNGFAVIPNDGNIYSPVSGTVKTVFPTQHAYIISTDKGLDVLVHIGIDTVELKGEGFDALVKEDQKVTPETLLVKVDFDFLKQQDKKIDVIVIFPEYTEDIEIKANKVSREKVCEIILD